MSTVDNQRLDIVGQIKDVTGSALPDSDPFLYYLPEFISSNQLSAMNPDQALQFCRLVHERGTLPVVKDALRILNQLVRAEDGTLLPVSRSYFLDNRSFLW